MKRNRLWWWIVGIIILLAFFTHIRNIALNYYYLHQANMDYNLAMRMMDKADPFNMYSYIQGILHGWVVGIIILIIIDR